MEEETREAKIEEDDRIEEWRDSKGQLKEGVCSEMDKVMNEETHLAEKKRGE